MIQSIEEIISKCRSIGYEYIDGYEGSNSTLTLKCPKCGKSIKRNWRAVRKIASGYQHTFICESCEEIKKRERAERQEQIYAEREKQREQKRDSELWDSSFNQITFSFCKNCGMPTWGKKYCSKACTRTYNDRRKKDRRLRKIRTVKQIYIDIKDLYVRDEGICHICGKVCDFEDYTIRDDGTFVAGNNYPSIDHVIPLSKGGSHSWGNVKLAHRVCNSRKSNKSLCG